MQDQDHRRARGVFVAAAAVLSLSLTAAGGASASSASSAYKSARATWKHAYCDSAANQSSYDWPNAAAELRMARHAPHSYRVAANRLTAIAQLPETGATTAQQRTFAADVSKLDAFFKTPHLYQSGGPQCPA